LQEGNFPLQVSDVCAFEKTNYPLTFVAVPGAQLSLRLVYDTYRFDPSTIARMVGHLKSLLDGIVAHPHQKLSSLPILSAAEQHQLLVEWNDTKADYPINLCLHQLFEAQVEQTPQSVAVIFEDQQFTYRELNARANKIAHHLQTLGVKSEVLVGICVERSLEMVVGLLGILKAGGAYVPLDPAYPQERLAFMLADSQVPILLTQEDLLPNFPEYTADVVCLDTDWEVISQQSQENPVSDVQAENVAYVIYTSGSTGKPKGVMIAHQAICNHMLWMQNSFPLTKADRVLQKTPFSFDASIWEFYAPLLVGAQLLVARPKGHQDSAYLVKLIAQQKVTTLQVVPSLLRTLIQEDEFKTCDSLKNIFCGGEALPVELQEHLFRNLDAQLHNLYGPTEACIDATFWTCKRGSVRQTILIGRPIANTQIYLLDQQLQPVPIGVPGELYIGGDGLARGYLNRPELTAERFILNPFNNSKSRSVLSEAKDPIQNSKQSDRLYKTGDKARYLSDGNIEFLGRIDHQVKIRGFRIELGEIEAVLKQHQNVIQSVVIVREDVPGDQRLVAYLVTKQQPEPTVEDLRHFLKQQLPEYMIPNAFVLLDTLPLTANGKLDRRALPAPDITRKESGITLIAARTPIEEILVGIWTEVLGVEQVGIHDNFFELGGHSLLVIQLISRVRTTFAVKLSLHSLFSNPTVSGLAECIEAALREGSLIADLPLLPTARDGKIPLSFAQARLWFLDQLESGSAFYNIPTAVRLSGLLHVAALEQSFNDIISRHETLRTNFTIQDGQSVQVIASTLTLSLPVIDLQDLPKTEQEIATQQLLKLEAVRSFDLAREPLVRAALLQLEETEHVLLLTMHHIVSDGWSMGVMVREFAALYEAYCNHLPPELPELPIQYADFAVWQRQWLQGEVLETQLAYWKKQLGANLPMLQFPTDYPRAEVKTKQGATSSFVIPAHLSKAIQVLSRREGVSLFMTLLATFQVLLQRYTNQDDIVVGTDVANRNRREVEPLIGFFVNLLVLRTDLSGNPTFRELLKRVREVALGAYAHQDLPFEKLVEALRPERKSSNAPSLFQVLFVLQNAPMPALELPGLSLNVLEVETEMSKFDLSLFLTETEEGIVGNWQYNSNLFKSNTIKQLSDHFETLLNSIVAQPDARINNLEMLTETEREQQTVKTKQHKTSNLKKFMAVELKAMELSQEKLIETTFFQPEETLPLIIKPTVDDVDIIDWVKNKRDFIETKLLHHGAILFRNFNVSDSSEFESLAEAICPGLFGEYGDLPREGVSGKVYGSTPYPADEAILFHNESSHMHCWPQKIWFFCVQPPQQRGETPIVDTRKILQLLDPKLRERFASKQLMYVRNYINSLDVRWQDFFHTSDKAKVEEYCYKASISVEWKPDDSLKISQVRPAVINHPKTGEALFFNQIQLHHPYCLKSEVRELLLSSFGENNLPRNVYYGDGSPIEDSVIEEILAVYQEAEVSFPWQKKDVLMLDNMLTAHGRHPYVGSRKIVVAMGQMIYSADIEHKGKDKVYAN